MPWVKQADHKCAFEYLQIASNRHIRNAEGSGKFRMIQYLPMVVAKHHPEATQGCCGNSNSKLGYIPFEKRSDVFLFPLKYQVLVMIFQCIFDGRHENGCYANTSIRDVYR